MPREYHTPNSLVTTKSFSFIYSLGHKIWIDHDKSHVKMLLEPEIFNHVFKDNKNDPDLYNHSYMHTVASDNALLGRVSPEKEKISFWNDNDDLIDKLLKPSLKELMKRHLIEDYFFIDAPTVYEKVSDILGNKDKEKHIADKEKLEKMRKLHTMSPKEKSSVLKNILGATPKINKWKHNGIDARYQGDCYNPELDFRSFL